MLLQQIVLQLDGELLRLKSLRGIVAGLAGSSFAVPDPGQRPAEISGVQAVLPAGVPDVAANGQSPLAGGAMERSELPVPARLVRGRGRPRKFSPGGDGLPAGEVEASQRVPRIPRAGRTARRAEPTALSRAFSVGPVVMSAAALLKEREARGAGASPGKNLPEAVPEVHPEAVARELAARWLTGPDKR